MPGSSVEPLVVRLAKQEERDTKERFGQTRHDYAAVTSRLFPRLSDDKEAHVY